MPDRFDLMERDEVLSSLRISSAWCARVNRSALDAADLSRLSAARDWIISMAAEFDHALSTNAPADLEIFDTAPARADVGPERDVIVDGFWKANERARMMLAGIARMDWSRSFLVRAGTTVSLEDLGRHIARVSQTASVDQRWIW